MFLVFGSDSAGWTNFLFDNTMSLQNVISSTVRGPDYSGYRFWWEGWGGQRKQENHVINVSQLQINFK